MEILRLERPEATVYDCSSFTSKLASISAEADNEGGTIMRKNQRFAFLAIGGLGLLAAIAPGLAAGIAVPGGGAVPAAGQGAVTVQGFVVTDIDWTVDDDSAKVTSVRFDIKRDASGALAVESAVGEAAGNAVVRVRLEKDASTTTTWTSCAATGGTDGGAPARATCTLVNEDQQMLASDLTTVNIIAFDLTTTMP